MVKSRAPSSLPVMPHCLSGRSSRLQDCRHCLLQSCCAQQLSSQEQRAVMSQTCSNFFVNRIHLSHHSLHFHAALSLQSTPWYLSISESRE